MKKTVSILLLLCMLFACLTAVAEDAAEDAAASQQAPVFQTADGVLSIQAPNATWVEIQEPDLWFAMTDGDDYILIDHLSNGQSLPSVQVANDAVPAVYQAFVSTKNEVFVIKGLSSSQEGLKSIMETISSIRVLQLDTKKAVQQAPAPQAPQYQQPEVPKAPAPETTYTQPQQRPDAGVDMPIDIPMFLQNRRKD